MPKSRTDSEWIDGFLRKELSDKDVVIFQGRLAQESAFASLFKEQQLLADGIRLSMLSNKVNHFQQLGQKIDGDLLEDQTIGQAVRYDKNLLVLERLREKGDILDKVEKQQTTKWSLTKYIFNKYAAVAAMLLIVLSSWWLNETYSNKSIIKNLYEPFLDYQQASTSQNNHTTLEEAKNAFFMGDYKIAISKLLTFSEKDNNIFYEAQGLLAFAYFHNQDYSMSIKQFDKIISYQDKLSVDFQDKNRLRWTRLLAYLGSNQVQSSFFKQELTFFLNHNSEKYREKAILLNKKINSNWRRLPLLQ